MPFKTDQTFHITSSSSGSTISIKINETAGVAADNLSLATWGSSFILANILHRYISPLPPLPTPISPITTILPILEIGSGTGLVGLSASLLFKRDVVFTDLEGILPGISANIALNSHLLANAGVRASSGVLDWTRPDTLWLKTPEERVLRSEEAKAQIIMAADTCYSEDHPELMVNTIERWLVRGKEARVFITYAQRVAYLDPIRELWERMEGIGLECFEEGREEGEERWDEAAPFEWCVWRWRE